MPTRKPNRFLAPVIIAGITVGFLVSAYKFIFAKKQHQPSTNVQAETGTTTTLQDIER